MWRHPFPMTLIRATCVSIEGAGVLIRGPSSSGKSDLALRLIDEGAVLVADDYCNLSPGPDGLAASAPDTIAGKLEVRGYGIVCMPSADCVAVGLVIDLVPKAEIERLPDVGTCTIDGVAVRRIEVDAETMSATAKVRLALNLAAENVTSGAASV